MGAQKRHLFTQKQKRNAELGLIVSAPARIEILRNLQQNTLVNTSILKSYIPLHTKTINHHINVIERSGLIRGVYVGNKYYWEKNNEMIEDWEKIMWVLE